MTKPSEFEESASSSLKYPSRLNNIDGTSSSSNTRDPLIQSSLRIPFSASASRSSKKLRRKKISISRTLTEACGWASWPGKSITPYIKEPGEWRKGYYVYMLRCVDIHNKESIYTGYSGDPLVRLRQHQTGKGARYTRSREVQMIYLEGPISLSAAMHNELVIKSMTRQMKLDLIINAIKEHGGLIP